MKSKAKRIVTQIWQSDGSAVEHMVRNSDNLKTCSCDMCCNPRHNKWNGGDGKTRKEIQAENDLAGRVRYS